MTGIIGRRGVEKRRLQGAVAMAYGYLNSSRAVGPHKISQDEVVERRRQALEFATSAFSQALLYGAQDIANAAVNLIIEVQRDNGHKAAIDTMLSSLWDRWQIDAITGPTATFYTVEQLHDLADSLDAISETELTGQAMNPATLPV